MDGQGGTPGPPPEPESSNDWLGLARVGLGALVAVLASVLIFVLLTRDTRNRGRGGCLGHGGGIHHRPGRH